jgi:hypothetical protein
LSRAAALYVEVSRYLLQLDAGTNVFLCNLLQANPKLRIDDHLVKAVALRLDGGDVNEMLFDEVQAKVRNLSQLLKLYSD